MNKAIIILLILSVFTGCKNKGNQVKRVEIAKAGDKVLYFDEIPVQLKRVIPGSDSANIVHNYINQWAKKELVYQKAEKNLSSELKDNIEQQLEETRLNLVVYEYEQQLMLEKMDTVITDSELEKYYSENERSFMLTSNIVKSLFIKLPSETPNIGRFRTLLHSKNQKDIQELESLCYQFAEKYDDFGENWINLDRLSLEMNKDIGDQENFLKRNTYYEYSDSASVYFLEINDYRLRGTLAPFEYVKGDIKRIIWNNRRIEFIQNLENGIYNDALKDNGLKIF